jgi:hypothetical protein
MAGGRRVGALILLALAVFATSAQASFFGPTGPWNAPLPATPAVEANSAAIVTTMVGKITASSRLDRFPYINTTSYSTPIWAAAAPRRRLVYDNDPNSSIGQAIAALNAAGGLPIPPDAQPARGTDGHIVIYDAPLDTFYELWRASSPRQNALTCLNALPWGEACHHDNQWHAQHAGIMDDVDLDPGVFSPQSWPTAGPTGWGWGARGTSLPLLGGLITFDDLRTGVIDHAVAASFKSVCRNYFVAPAQRRDGSDTSASCLPEGARLQLDPAYNVSADANPPLTKAIERAAQKFGIVIVDGGGPSIQFNGQDPQTEPSNPYTSGPGLGGADNGGRGFFGGVPPYELFKNFPWARLRVVAATHCTAAPCQ